MTQDERWMLRYNEVMEFMAANHRNPSRHRIEDHDMLNWLKVNRKKMNAGELPADRVEKYNKPQALVEKYKRVNQFG